MIILVPSIRLHLLETIYYEVMNRKKVPQTPILSQFRASLFYTYNIIATLYTCHGKDIYLFLVVLTIDPTFVIF